MAVPKGTATTYNVGAKSESPQARAAQMRAIAKQKYERMVGATHDLGLIAAAWDELKSARAAADEVEHGGHA